VACYGASTRLRLFQRCPLARAAPEANGGRYDASLVERLEAEAPMSAAVVQRFGRDGAPRGAAPRGLLLAVIDPAHLTAEKRVRSNEEPVQQALCEAGGDEGIGTYGRDMLEQGRFADALSRRVAKDHAPHAPHAPPENKRARVAHAGPLAIYADLAAASGVEARVAGAIIEDCETDAAARYSREEGEPCHAACVEMASERLLAEEEGEGDVWLEMSDGHGRVHGRGAALLLHVLAAHGHVRPVGEEGDFRAESPQELVRALDLLDDDVASVMVLLREGTWLRQGAWLRLRAAALSPELACLLNALLDYARCAAKCYRYRLRHDALPPPIPAERAGRGVYCPHLPQGLGGDCRALETAIRNHWSPHFLDALLRVMPANDLEVNCEEPVVELVVAPGHERPFLTDADFFLRRPGAPPARASLADRNALPNPFFGEPAAPPELALACAIGAEPGGALVAAAYRSGYEVVWTAGARRPSDEELRRLCPKAALSCECLTGDVEDGWGMERCDGCGRCTERLPELSVRPSERYAVVELSAGFHAAIGEDGPVGFEDPGAAAARLLLRGVDELRARAARLRAAVVAYEG
jgi:hypothetical protein